MEVIVSMHKKVIIEFYWSEKSGAILFYFFWLENYFDSR